MKFDLTQSCILYMQNPQMAVQQVASNYNISIQEAGSILKRKCANMLPDSEYSNWFGSKVAKERRMDVSKGKALAKFNNVRRITDCDELEDSMQDINSELDYESTKLVGAKKGGTRVGTRTIQGLNRVYKMEEEQMLSDVFSKAEQSRQGIKKGTNLTTYIAIGVGVLILGTGILLAVKKAKQK